MTHLKRMSFTVLGALALLLCFSACQSSGSAMNGFGNQSSGTGSGLNPNGTNPYSPLDPSLTGNTISAISTSPPGGGSNCTGSSASSCGFTGFDASSAGQVISGLNPINPATSGITSDLKQQVQNVVAEAASGNLTQADQARFTLAGEIMKQTADSAAAYAPQPGQPMLGTYEATCPPIKGYTNGHIVATVSGNYPSYNIDLNFPKLAKWSGVSSPGDSLNVQVSAGAGYVYVGLTSSPSAASGKLTIYNSAAHYNCKTTFGGFSSTSPIPANAAQGLKVLADGYRKALLLMSPLFDTMFKTMNPQTAQTLLLAAMGMSN